MSYRRKIPRHFRKRSNGPLTAYVLDPLREYFGHWEGDTVEGVSDEKCAEFTGISRASYYRYVKVLRGLERGISPPSKYPKTLNKPLCLKLQESLPNRNSAGSKLCSQQILTKLETSLIFTGNDALFNS